MRSNGTPCPHGFKWSKKGKVRNRAHVCTIRCSWSGADCLVHLRRLDEEQGRVQVEHVPCECGKSYAAHFGTIADSDGRFQMLKWIDCGYKSQGTRETRHLLTCDCLECVTTRLTADHQPAA